MPTILPAITDIGIKIAAKVNYARWLRAIKTGIANISLPDEHAIRADGAKFLELMNTYRIAKADDSPWHRRKWFGLRFLEPCPVS
jgi:hypothetical protein